MAYAEGIIFAFAHLRKAAQPAGAAQCSESLAPSGQHLVGIGLMPHVEDDFVKRSIIDIMQSYNEFHGTEA